MGERERVRFCDEEAAFRLLVGVVRQAHVDAADKWASPGYKWEAADFLAGLQGCPIDKVVARRPSAIVDRPLKYPPRKRRNSQEEDW